MLRVFPCAVVATSIHLNTCENNKTVVKPLYRPTRGLPEKIADCSRLAPSQQPTIHTAAHSLPTTTTGQETKWEGVRKVMVWNKDREITQRRWPDFQEYLTCKLFVYFWDSLIIRLSKNLVTSSWNLKCCVTMHKCVTETGECLPMSKMLCFTFLIF